MRYTGKEIVNFVSQEGIVSIAKALLDYKSDVLCAHPPGSDRPLMLRKLTSDLATYIQVFYRKEYALTLGRQPKVIVDAGANIGCSAIYFHSMYPGCRIYSLEPEDSNFELLSRNVEGYPEICPLQYALWSTSGTVNISDPSRGKWGFRVAQGGDANILQSVKSISVDDLLRELSLPFIDILKLDIEGAEREVFLDASSWIDRVGILIVELHDRIVPGCARSFYNATNSFANEWIQGENIVLANKEWAAQIRF